MFNENEATAWKMSITDYESDTWEKVNLSNQPDRWVIELLNMQEMLIMNAIIKKNRQPYTLDVFEMSSMNENGVYESNSWQALCLSPTEEYDFDLLLKNNDIREMLKKEFYQQMLYLEKMQSE